MSVIDSLIDQRDAFMRELVQLKQALDAKDARIKELEGALRDVQPILDDVLLSYHEALRNEWRRKAHAWHDRAREALK